MRDYPDGNNPLIDPDWPGYRVPVEGRPNVTGIPRHAAQKMLRAWRERRAVEVRSAHRINRLLPGPCAPPNGGAG